MSVIENRYFQSQNYSARVSGRFRVFETAGPLVSPPLGFTWRELMELALDAARMGEKAGEVPVGAVLAAPDGHILAKCANRVERDRDPTAHAEMLALRQGAMAIGNQRLNDCILIVTLEPCLMCAGAIMHARISGLVFGAADNLAGAVISHTEYFALPNLPHQIWHLGGVLSDECAVLLKNFFSCRR